MQVNKRRENFKILFLKGEVPYSNLILNLIILLYYEIKNNWPFKQI